MEEEKRKREEEKKKKDEEAMAFESVQTKLKDVSLLSHPPTHLPIHIHPSVHLLNQPNHPPTHLP